MTADTPAAAPITAERALVLLFRENAIPNGSLEEVLAYLSTVVRERGPLMTEPPFSPILPPSSCAGGCGRASTNPILAGWDHLPIAQRWRCRVCTTALQSIGRTRSHSAPDMSDPAEL